MLEREQAFQILREAIKTLGGPSGITGSETLSTAGITEVTKRAIGKLIAEDPTIGVPQFEQSIAPDFADDIDLGNTIESMTQKIMQLSSGKLCSNPVNPHEQTCCPYPSICPECSYAVW